MFWRACLNPSARNAPPPWSHPQQKLSTSCFAGEAFYLCSHSGTAKDRQTHKHCLVVGGLVLSSFFLLPQHPIGWICPGGPIKTWKRCYFAVFSSYLLHASKGCAKIKAPLGEPSLSFRADIVYGGNWAVAGTAPQIWEELFSLFFSRYTRV